MGYVYRARDTNFKAIRLVAVKEMITNVTDPLVAKKIHEIYDRESNILASLRHHSIPRIYDYFVIDERAYLVMEFINGKNLDDVLAETTTFFPEEQVINWAVELCDVLGYLHNQEPVPIIFRDMKPTNVMLNPQNHVVLVDFGIAKIFEDDQKNTMVGTQGYSPPDQYRGEATPRVDIYALGATLHHLLTLRDPRLEAPFTFNERPVKEINPNVSDEMAAVLDKCLEYEPDNRYQTALEMSEALQGVAQKTGALLNTGLVTTGAMTKTKGVKSLWTFECEDEVRGSPLYHDGGLFVGCYDNNLYALDASNGEFRWKYATDGGLPGKPAYYDNNIYLGSEDNRLHVISSRSGNVVWTHYTEAPVRSSPRIAQGHVFIGSDDGNLHAVNLTSGRLSWKMDAGAAVRSTPYVTEDNVYFGSEAGEFFCLDFRGEIKWRFKAKRAITSSPIIANDVIYFSSLDSTLYALDANTGWVLWRFRLGKGSVSTAAVMDKQLFIGAADHVVYCVDTQSAKELWRFTTDHQVAGSPIIFKDSVYIGSVDGHLYNLDRKSGQVRWQFLTEGQITGTPTAFDDIIYIGSTDKKIYALLA